MGMYKVRGRSLLFCWFFVIVGFRSTEDKQKSILDAQQEASGPAGAHLTEMLAPPKWYLAT